MSGSTLPPAEGHASSEDDGAVPVPRRILAFAATVIVGFGAGAVGGALAAFVTFWSLILGSFFGGPRPSPSAWTWQGLMFVQLYLAEFLVLGAAIGGLIGLLSVPVVARFVGHPPSSRERRMIELGCGLVGIAAMWVFEFRILNMGGVWMTLSFMFGGLTGGVVGARLWLRKSYDEAAEPS